MAQYIDAWVEDVGVVAVKVLNVLLGLRLPHAMQSDQVLVEDFPMQQEADQGNDGKIEKRKALYKHGNGLQIQNIFPVNSKFFS
jgi:hypothetical protein